VRLEAEVQSNPARRRIYQDYCRMQKACKVLAHDFQTEPVGADDKKVVPFSVATAGRASRGNTFYTVGAFAAAAACLAIIFVGRSRQQAGAEAQLANVAAMSESVVVPQVVASETKGTGLTVDTAQARMARAVANKGIRRAEQPLQATFVSSNDLYLGANPSADAVTVAAAQSANDQFDWLRAKASLVPMDQQAQLDQLRFQAPVVTLRPDGRVINNRPMNKAQQEPATEMVTFQLTLGR
jgi:hypothetical protein